MTEMLILGGAFVICILLTWAVNKPDKKQMIQNAHQARQLVKKSVDPKLELTLEVIEIWASQGKYEGTPADPISEKLANNLRARGFGVYKDTITW